MIRMSDLPEGTKLRISNVNGHDFEDNMWTCSVGEAARRFTAEQVEDGTAEKWMAAVVELIRSGGKR
jgi:hypothetical protein